MNKSQFSNGKNLSNDTVVDLQVPGSGQGIGQGGGRPDSPGGGNGGGQGGGSGGGRPDNPGGGSGKGDLYGDQYVLLRDLTPADGGGNGEPVLDINGQPILVGSDGSLIYFELDPVTGDYDIPADKVALVQEVELGRANVARAPDSVMEKSLSEAMSKIMAATVVDSDAAGRITTDGVAIDSPLENLALYQYLMTAGGQQSWEAVQEFWPEPIAALTNWDPSSLLGAAFDKFSPVSMDAVLYLNTTIGVNQVNGSAVDYFDFTVNGTEAYDYSREARWSDTYIQWYQNLDDDPELELVEPTSVYEAVFGSQEWTDQYVQSDGSTQPVENAGVNDFAQAVEDARAVIYFMHENLGAIEVLAPEPEMTLMAPFALTNDQIVGINNQSDSDGHGSQTETVIIGTNFEDWLFGAGGAQYIEGGNGSDHIYGRGGPDTLLGGNGSDELFGGGGRDVLIGGNGSDILDGGPGPDILTGGNGPDVFVIGSTHGHDGVDGQNSGGGHDSDHGEEHGHTETLVASDLFLQESHGMDIITDFKLGVDVLDFSGVEGQLHFSDSPEAFGIWVEQSGNNTMVYADSNGHVSGSEMAELSVQLVGVSAEQLGADSFVV
jgi:hypothetical protein